MVTYLRSRTFPLEQRQRRLVLAAGDRAVAVSDAKITLHGFAQCTLFWLAACRLTRRGRVVFILFVVGVGGGRGGGVVGGVVDDGDVGVGGGGRGCVWYI